MTKGEKRAVKRAIELLKTVVPRFIEDNPISDYTVVYDEAECDGYCLQEDCIIAATELEQLFRVN